MSDSNLPYKVARIYRENIEHVTPNFGISFQDTPTPVWYVFQLDGAEIDGGPFVDSISAYSDRRDAIRDCLKRDMILLRYKQKEKEKRNEKDSEVNN